MPRNSSGVYTLPVAAFTPGQVITAANENSNNGDIGTALTQSLATTGVSSMTGQIKLAEGAAAAPALAFASDLDTGLYHIASGQYAFVSNGSVAFTVNPDLSVSFAGSIVVPGALNFAGAVTFGGIATFSAGIAGPTLIFDSGSTPLTLNRTENDASNRTFLSMAFGNRSGIGINFNAVGGGANNVASFQLASSTGTDLLDIDPVTQIITVPGFLNINNYIDFGQIATPAAPGAGKNRLYANAAGRMAYQAPAGIENPLSQVLMSVTTLTSQNIFEVVIPSDALEVELVFPNYISVGGATAPALNVSVSGVYDTGNNYSWVILVGNTTSAIVNTSTAQNAFRPAGISTIQNGSYRFKILAPNVAGSNGRFIEAEGTAVTNPGGTTPVVSKYAAFYFGSAAAIDKFKITVPANTFTTVAYVYKRV